MIRTFPRQTALATVALAAVLGLAGCGKHADSDSNAGSHQASASAVDNTQLAEQQASDTKFNAYVDAYNRLADRYGLSYHADNYLKQDVAHASKGDRVSFAFEMKSPLEVLQQAHSLPSTALPEIDSAADALIKDLQTLQDLAKEHGSYYQGEGYREDNYALAKQLDTQIRGAYEDALSQFEKLDTGLEQAQQVRDEKALAELKQLPDQIHYDTKLVLMLGKRLIDTVASAESPKDAEAMAKADEVRTQLYQATVELDKEIKNRDNDGSLSSSSRVVVLQQAQSLLNNYGQMRDSGNARLFQLMVQSYNGMVSNANQI